MIAAKAMIMNVYIGGEETFDPADTALYDIIPGLSGVEKVHFPDPNLMPNHFTIIGQVNEV